MRGYVEWAESLMTYDLLEGDNEPDRGYLASLIREAQEDGARAEREKAEHEIDSWRQGVEVFGLEVHALRAQVAALTERAERAEREANEYNELVVETSSKLDDAEYERDEAVKALDAHKERADRAESELHRRKF